MANVFLTTRCAALVCACLAISGCTGLFFHPDRREILNPAQMGLVYQDVDIRTPDGLTLHGWWLGAAAPSAGTVLFLHGNAENITTHIASVWWLPQAHFNVLLVDYRGYGRSQGEASLDGVFTDIDATLDYLLQTPGLDNGNVIVFGQSLGGALAVTAVANSRHKPQIRALVIDSAFSGYRAITREKMAEFWLTWPFQWLPMLTISERYDPVKTIGRVAPVPLLIVHGAADRIVPSHHATKLLDAAAEPKALWLIPDRGHIQAFGDAVQRERLVDFMRRAIADATSLPAAPGE